jgi:hypothetical protein
VIVLVLGIEVLMGCTMFSCELAVLATKRASGGV